MLSEANYRRLFLDMHIDDWNDEFLSRLDPQKIVALAKDCQAQSLVIKGKPHTGLCYWPSSIGRMHRGLKGRDYVGEMIGLCHANQIEAILYYSQVFDNWAYDNHPSWRCIYADGLTSRLKNHIFFRKGRYGVVCPNHPEYRDYVRHNLQELSRNYQFEAIFLDMPFWPEVCYCPSCKEKYLRETGRELPRIVDWDDPDWLDFQQARERWMGDFAAMSTRSIKDIQPGVAVEHNFAVAMFPWQFANTERVMDACDFAGGDYYGGYLQQTFACKYYRNVSPTMPFDYITSRCDPDLIHHTSTKTREELLLHAMIALVHNGAFSVVDGLNPDGSICDYVYSDVIKPVFQETSHYEKFVSGRLLSNVSIWFPTFAKYNREGNGRPVAEQPLDIEGFSAGMVRMASILRESHIPFDVVSRKNLKDFAGDVLVLSDIQRIQDDEMAAIAEYVGRGGHLYVSGAIGHPALAALIGVRITGRTEHRFTYMNPTDLGRPLFEGLDAQSPLTVNEAQQIVDVLDPADVLATITLPYTTPDSPLFASIHSDPPGIHTGMPAIILKQAGQGKIMWIAAPIEKNNPYVSRKIVRNLITSMVQEMKFSAQAPRQMEIVAWEKDGKRYLAALNQQEIVPVAPACDVSIELAAPVRRATNVGNGQALVVEHQDGRSIIRIPRVDLFMIIEVE